MPVNYRIFGGWSFVLSTALGKVTDAELLAHQKELLGDKDFDPSYPQLDDVRDADMDRITTGCIQTLAKTSAASRQGTKRALVVRGDLAYGLARMLQALREGSRQEIRVFRDLDRALGWLGVS
jgi:hypothetical protein